jgi:hypothetical protein
MSMGHPYDCAGVGKSLEEIPQIQRWLKLWAVGGGAWKALEAAGMHGSQDSSWIPLRKK